MSVPKLDYLVGYREEVLDQVRALIEADQLGAVLAERYPKSHGIRTNKTLYEFAMAIKRESMSSSPPLSKVCYSDDIEVLNRALGLHTYATRVQGGKLKTKNEVRVASVFKRGPPEFLTAVVVHELAHLREREHDKAFYRLCCHMLPDYHQLEFDMRLWLTWLAVSPG